MSHQIKRTLSAALTAKELIDELSFFDSDAKVLFVCDYGDIGHTQQALPVGMVELLDEECERLEESGYSQSHVAVEAVDDDEEPEPTDQEVVLIRCG